MFVRFIEPKKVTQDIKRLTNKGMTKEVLGGLTRVFDNGTLVLSSIKGNGRCIVRYNEKYFDKGE